MALLVNRPRLRSFYRGFFRRLPWWVEFLLGLAAVAIGCAITTKPFASLGVLVVLVAAALILTGISEIASAESALIRRAGLAWLVLGGVVALWPDLTIRGLAILVGTGLFVGGLLRIVSGIRGTVDERLIAFLSGVARSVFGSLALSWPDVTVLVLALLVGPAMILFGLGQVASALRHRRTARQDDANVRSRWPVWLRAVGAAVSLLVALGLLGTSAWIHRSSSESNAFYAAPSSVPAKHGVLLRSEPFSRGVPDEARAWRILYTTTRDDGTPALASGIVLVSNGAPVGQRPVIAWAHGTTGFASKCAPSLLRDPFRAGAMPALGEVVSNGWVLVATDYVGLGTEGPHPYLIGGPVGRSVLDSVLAARQLDEVHLENRTVVWGHSQGGAAALWTGILAASYAPDANVIGVAALSPATQLPPIFDAAKDTLVGKIMGSYVISAYSAAYPDVSFNDYVRPGARLLARQTARRCLSGPEALVSVGTALGRELWFSRSPATGALGDRLVENIPAEPIRAPLLIGQGLADTLVLPTAQKRWVDERCRAGQRLEYRTYEGLDHLSIVLDADSPLVPDLIEWTQDRLEGKPQANGCKTVTG
jgi:uncharacterized membrane protein HdeD (DUF308 family)/alpha-beta hydrolase superfamily lysophospholipase